MTETAKSNTNDSGPPRFSRRAAMAGGAAGFAGLTGIAAQASTPVAMPSASLIGSPQPPAILFPTPAPEPVYPLVIVEDQRPEWASTSQSGGEIRLFIKRNLIAARNQLSDNGWVDWDGDGVLDSPFGDRGAFVCIAREDADPGFLSILDSLNADFSDLGFELEVQRLSADDFATRWTSSFDYDLIAISLNQYAAFSEFDLFGSPWSIRRNPVGWNPGGYFSPEVDEAIVTFLQSWKIEDMKAALCTIQRVTNDDPFALWLGFPQQSVLVRPDIAGFEPNKMWQSRNTPRLWHNDEASFATPDVATPATAQESDTPVATSTTGPEGAT